MIKNIGWSRILRYILHKSKIVSKIITFYPTNSFTFLYKRLNPKTTLLHIYQHNPDTNIPTPLLIMRSFCLNKLSFTYISSSTSQPFSAPKKPKIVSLVFHIYSVVHIIFSYIASWKSSISKTHSETIYHNQRQATISKTRRRIRSIFVICCISNSRLGLLIHVLSEPRNKRTNYSTLKPSLSIYISLWKKSDCSLSFFCIWFVFDTIHDRS